MKGRNTAVASVLLAWLTITIATAQPPDWSTPPALGPAPTVTLPQIQKRQLSNGLAVWLVEQHEVPVVQVNLVVKSGTTFEPSGKYGIGSLTAAMMTEGAGGRSSLELADAIDFLGADLSATIGFDSWAVRLHVPVARLGEALPLMSDVAMRPTFPAAELERLRQQRLTGLVQAKDDASTIAAVAFSRVLYGDSRYGTPVMGTARSITSLTVDDLRSFYNAQFKGAPAAVIVVGDVTADAVMPQLERAFGAWPSAAPAVTPVTAAPPRQFSRREIYLVDKPGAPQSQVRIGLPGVTRNTPDYFPLTVMNTVLGGSFSSRLNMNLREQHGYTYGASSQFDMRGAIPGPFVAAAGVQSDKTSEALVEFFKELNGILQVVPAEELARSKNYIALRYPGGFETTGDISRRLDDAFVYNLPDDYFSRYVPSIQAVSAGAVAEVARKYIRPEAVVIVVVGDLKAIEPGIKALNLGPIHYMRIDEAFGQ